MSGGQTARVASARRSRSGVGTTVEGQTAPSVAMSTSGKSLLSVCKGNGAKAGKDSVVGTSLEHVRRIEDHAVQAWPAPVSERVDGWLLRHTPGMTRLRASGAALPLAGASRASSSLDRVEAFYADRDAPVAVQVSPATEHLELDRRLAARGYRFGTPIQVLTAAADVAAAARQERGWVVVVEDRPTASWLDAWVGLDGHDDSAQVTEQVVSKIMLPAGYLSVRADDRLVGVGLVVGGDDEWVGVYCMATHPDHRAQGIGRAVVRAGAQWAKDHGASGLYLQVERDNEAAQRTYAGAGFACAYDYHYRLGPGAGLPICT
jgi:ribosomal protein S18 acetylase RimI-like enzyme